MLRWLLTLSCLLIGGCNPDRSDPASAGGGPSSGITVFAAASLADAFIAARDALPHVRPTFSFSGSQQVATQVEHGARADVVATADEATMQRLVDAELVDRPVAFARTMLVIAVEPGNPERIAGLADLARPGIDVVLADASVPAGRYARRVLDGAGVRVEPRSLELDVRAALAKVTSGAADAAIVYVTDVRAAGGRADAVPFREAFAPDAAVTYRMAVVRTTNRRSTAEAFVAAAVDGPVRESLLAAGFLP